MLQDRFIIIMAGGAGERFWPVSRQEKPKYLCSFADDKKCLLMQTFERCAKVVSSKNVLILTNKTQAENIKKVCPEIPSAQIFCEPALMDTSAAIAYSASLILERTNFKNALFAVCPSDAAIANVEDFVKTMNEAFAVADSGLGDRLVTIGIPPSYAATGYGYIERGEKFSGKFGEFYRVAHFYEKPNLERAKSYIESKNFYWNAGIFVWSTSSITSAIKNFAPKIYEPMRLILDEVKSGKSLIEAAPLHYSKFEKISIDFSVMEKSDNVWVVPAKFDWDDVGSWSAIERLGFAKDENQNILIGEAYLSDSKNNILFDKDGRMTAFAGVENLVVVHTKDTTLICSKDYAQKLKNLVKTLPEKYK